MKQGFGKLASLKEAKEVIFSLIKEKEDEIISIDDSLISEHVKIQKNFEYYQKFSIFEARKSEDFLCRKFSEFSCILKTNACNKPHLLRLQRFIISDSAQKSVKDF